MSNTTILRTSGQRRHVLSIAFFLCAMLLVNLQLHAQYGTLIRQDYRDDDIRSEVGGIAIDCPDTINCIMAGSDNVLGRRIAARFTHDGGKTWSTWRDTPATPLSSYLRDIAYPTPSLALMVGDSGMIYRSTDGGESWREIDTRKPYKLFHISMSDSLHGVIVGNLRLLFHTDDGGLTWQPMALPPSIPDVPDSIDLYIEDIATIAPLHLSVARYYVQDNTLRYVVSTTFDGGTTWRHASAPFIKTIRFLDARYGWTVGEQVTPTKVFYISRTTDSGRTWRTVFFDTLLASGFSSLDFADSLNGLAGGNEGLYRTYDGGETWINLFDVWGIKNEPFARGPLFLRYPARGKAWMYNAMLGTLLYSEDEPTNATQPEKHDGRRMRLSPNPARGEECVVSYALPRRCRGRLSLVDVIGREVMLLAEGEFQAGESRFHIPLGGLAAGRYFVRMTSDQWVDTFGFVRE